MTAEIRNRLIGAKAAYQCPCVDDGVMAAASGMAPHFDIDDAVDEIDQPDDRTVVHQFTGLGARSGSPSL